MYQFDDVGSTFLSLPPNLQTIKNDCFGYALDRQMAKMHKIAKQITVWSDLDSVDPKYYDFLAMTIRAPYYKSEYSGELKLGLIKSALLTRRYAGTMKAIEELISHTFPNAIFVPWYEYDGKPYHFKITIKEEMLIEDAMKLFEEMLQRTKAARSIIEAISVTHRIDQQLFAGCATQSRITNVILDGAVRGYAITQRDIAAAVWQQTYTKNKIIEGCTDGTPHSITVNAGTAAD